MKAVPITLDDSSTRLQLAALCWRVKDGKTQVLLVTSRETGRWVLPKGWPMLKRSASDAAATEAWEEAGAKGLVGQVIGSYDYEKVIGRGSRKQTFLRCNVAVHTLQVTGLSKSYPERKQRRRKWFSPERAAQLVDEPQLSTLLADFVEPKACADQKTA